MCCQCVLYTTTNVFLLMRVCSNRTEENQQLHLFDIITSLLRIVCSQVDTLRMDDPNNFTTLSFCHINGVISPVHGVRLSSGKKHCVSKEEDYEKRDSLNWANLNFNLKSPKGPFIKYVRKIFGILDPPSL